MLIGPTHKTTANDLNIRIGNSLVKKVSTLIILFPLPNLQVISGVTVSLNPGISQGSASIPTSYFLPRVKSKNLAVNPGFVNSGSNQG